MVERTDVGWRQSGVVELDPDEHGVVEIPLGQGRMFKVRLLRSIKVRFCASPGLVGGDTVNDFFLHIAQNSAGNHSIEWLTRDDKQRPVYLTWDGGTPTQNLTPFGFAVYHFLTPDGGRTIWGFRRTNYASQISGDTLFADEQTIHKEGNTVSVKDGGITVVQLADGSVSNSKLRTSSARSVIGRASNTTGAVADIQGTTPGSVLQVNSLGTDLAFGLIDGISIAAGAVGASQIADGSVSVAKLSATPNSSGQLLSYNGSGLLWVDPVTSITIENAQDAVGATLTNTSTIDLTYNDTLNQITATLRDDSIGTQHLGNGVVSAAKFRSSSALSVVGRSVNSSGSVADITATANSDHVLRVSGTGIGWGLLTTGSLSDGSVTGQKIGDDTLTERHLLSSNGPMDGFYLSYDTGTDRFTWVAPPAPYTDEHARDVVAAMFYNSATIDVSYDDPNDSMSVSLRDNTIDTIKIVDQAVSNAKLRNSAALSVVGRASNSVGSVADIVAGTDAHVLRRFGNTLGFGQVDGSAIANGTVTGSKLADGTVTEANLDILNVPSGGQLLRWNALSSKPEWVTINPGGGGGSDPDPQDTAFTYTGSDLTRVDYADGTYKTFAYDQGRLATLVHHRATDVVTKAFIYDVDGTLTNIDVTIT